MEEERNRRLRRRRNRGSADAKYAMARRAICPRSARAHRPGGRTPGNPTEPGVAVENPKSRNHPRGVAPMSMGSCECELAGPSASKAGESLPLYVEASTGCRAF